MRWKSGIEIYSMRDQHKVYLHSSEVNFFFICAKEEFLVLKVAWWWGWLIRLARACGHRLEGCEWKRKMLFRKNGLLWVAGTGRFM